VVDRAAGHGLIGPSSRLGAVTVERFTASGGERQRRSGSTERTLVFVMGNTTGKCEMGNQLAAAACGPGSAASRRQRLELVLWRGASGCPTSG